MNMREILLSFALLLTALCLLSVVSHIPLKSEIIPAIGNSIENIELLKQDCEESLPRDQECTLIYEFVPTKKVI